MFASIRNKAIDLALTGLRDKFVNPRLEGIGRVHAISWREKKLYLTITLDGLPETPIEVICHDIQIGEQAESVGIGHYDASLPFAKNALNRYACGPFSVPEGGVRTALQAAKTCLGI